MNKQTNEGRNEQKDYEKHCIRILAPVAVDIHVYALEDLGLQVVGKIEARDDSNLALKSSSVLGWGFMSAK